MTNLIRRVLEVVICLLCIEVAKEAIKPADFWRNYKEISEEHMEELVKAVANTSIDYQLEIATYLNKSEEDSET